MAIYPKPHIQIEFPNDLPCATCSKRIPIVYMDHLCADGEIISRNIVCKCDHLEVCRAIQRQLKERMNLHEPDNPNG